MQFSIMSVFALAAVAIASPRGIVKREVVDGAIPVNAPAMTDATGNVIPFVAKDVYVHPAN